MDTLDLDDVQGLVVRGYGRLRHAAFLLYGVADAETARNALGRWAGQVTSGAVVSPESAVNVALTAAGLRALAVPASIVASFSPAFAEGMTTEHRSRLLGDVGDADPRRWSWGGPGGAEVHVLVLVYAATADALRRRVNALERGAGGLSRLAVLPTDPLTGREPFGFRDGLSQPRLAGVVGGDGGIAPGEFVLGYRNAYGRFTERPVLPASVDPNNLLPRDEAGSGGADLGRNGSYLVLRQLSQDVDGFWSYVREHGGDGAEGARRLAAKMMGRWPSGAPVVLSPERDDPELAGHDFRYHETDPDGLACPLGAHVRRANPRDSLPPRPGSAESMTINDRHRLLRRGRSYTRRQRGGDTERGLYFLCLNANLARQYEFVQHSWLNDPTFNGLRDDPDPVVAPRVREGAVFTEQARPVRVRHRALPEFVRVRGGAYFFLPGIAALRYLATVMA
ncbi:Dyp-type peroxidase family [Amycolatopsis sacchari]|uniref:Dyp-type peroxidase family n=1 Tax=Amycolatopsis sacchari TaxID=115433 RepID=A0A1I3KK85_9PSEU|nr:Dyp-type peroxidase [Amycolatopsis sacchari]SFI72886.1 Dyp-type peroxidase family [Amycolatopsis sacchari]